MDLRIRLARDTDAVPIAAIYRPIVETTAISFETAAPDAAEIARRIAETLPTFPWLVCEVAGTVVGYAYAGRHRARAAYRWSVDTSVYVDDAFRRRGIAQTLYGSLFTRLEAQGFVNAYAGIALPNDASVRLHESLGFEPVGVYRRVGYKVDRWHDVGWWWRALRPPDDPPNEPLPLAAETTPGIPPAGLASGVRRRAVDEFDGALLLVVSLWIRPDSVAAFERYERVAAALIREHGGRIEQAVRVSPTPDQPDAPFEIHLVRFPSAAHFRRYRDDPAQTRLASERAAVIARTEITRGIDGPVYVAGEA